LDLDTKYAVLQGNAWRLRGAARDEGLLLAYLAFLNSYQFESILELFCPKVGGGQYQLYEAELERVPLPDLSRVSPRIRQSLTTAGRRVVEGKGLDPWSVGSDVAICYGMSVDAFKKSFALGQGGALQDIFDQLVSEWKSDRGHTSKVRTMTGLRPYRDLVALGKKATPLILRELRKSPDWYFTALEEITQENPVRASERGRLKQMSDSWITWGLDRCQL
jgi:hypothetical protein